MKPNELSIDINRKLNSNNIIISHSQICSISILLKSCSRKKTEAKSEWGDLMRHTVHRQKEKAEPGRRQSSRPVLAGPALPERAAEGPREAAGAELVLLLGDFLKTDQYSLMASPNSIRHVYLFSPLCTHEKQFICIHFLSSKPS